MADDATLTAASSTKSADGSLGHSIIWVLPQLRVSSLDEPLEIGRAPNGSSGIAGHFPGSLISRRHARITEGPGVGLLQDLHSKNGTFLNGHRVTRSPLHPDDVVRIGEWVGVVTDVPTEVSPMAPVGPISEVVFGGPKTRIVFERIQRVASSELRVMLVGETGTGKEVFAKEIHRLSGVTGRWVAMNCAAVPEQIAEAELFGYRRGAFTGADRAHVGHFRSAHEGTLFLDEISDLALPIQVKILRALEERAVLPLGQSRTEAANARVLCASQEPLHHCVEEGKFRADLYSRLNGVEIRIPPLRQRREEVVPLLRHLLEGHGLTPTLSPECAEQLCIYDWPLNVRELVQLAEQIRALRGDQNVLRLEHLPERIATFTRTAFADAAAQASPAHSKDEASDIYAARQPPQPARDQLAQRLKEVLRETNGNVTSAAARLGLSRAGAYRLLKRLPDVDPEEIRLERHIKPDLE